MTDLNYKDDLEIDELDLVYTWLVQATLYGKWAELWADASYRVDKLTERRKIKRAQIYSDVKLNPNKYEWREALCMKRIVNCRQPENRFWPDDHYSKNQAGHGYAPYPKWL